MRIEFNSRPKSALFIGCSLVLSLAYLYAVQEFYRASASAEGLSRSGLEKAVQLAPGDAEFHDLLGRYYLFAAQDAGKAQPQFLEAARLDAHSSRYWLDLATAKGLLLDTAGQRQALQRALQVDPKTPKVAWEAGNFFLMDGDTDAALDSFKTVIEYDRVQSPLALGLCWRATHDAGTILAHAMPQKPEPYLELLNLLVAKKETDAVIKVWRSFVALDEPFSVTDTMPVVEYLIQQKDVAGAQEVWSGMAKQSASLRPATNDQNLIVNGSFDEEIVPGGFSWKLALPALNNTRLDTREFRSGMASISFDFEGPAFSDYGFSQVVPVKGGHSYQLFVTAKSQEIQSMEGPRIMVEDAFSHTLLAKGPEWQGTHGWDEVSILFSTLADTSAVRIYLGRAGGTGLVRGTLWLDDFRMYER